MAGRAVRVRSSNLPAELTSFVGRRQELRELKRLLASTRLLTLTGSGGAGKTRLALRAAAEIGRGFPDGVWFISLGSLQDPLLLTQAVFNALGVQDLSAGVSLSALTDYLAKKRILLVLDNCEHLLDACAVLVGTLTKGCPELYVLATSRQALGIVGEVRMVVPPMSLPAEGEAITADRFLTSDAVLLLIERAASVVPGFTIAPDNRAAVIQLCRRLDGIPLALELAAGRLGSLSLDQLNQGLASELSILGTGDRSAEARQQTLEATIAWSYGLLNTAERLLWARLSVFAGGFGEEAAIEVCADPQLPAAQIPAILGGLVEKSMLTLAIHGPTSGRYGLLETLRQYGRQRLRELGEEPAMQKRHLSWIRGLAKVVGMWDSRQVEMFHLMHQERDNLWAALNFCLQQRSELAVGAEIAHALMPFWACRGPYGDVRRVLTSLADQAAADSLSRARLLWVAAVMAASQNDYEACAVLSAEGLRIGTYVKDAEVVAWSLIMSSIPRWIGGDLPGATASVESALALARVMRLELLELEAFIPLCGMLIASGDLDRVLDLGEQGLAISKRLGERWERGYLLNYLSQANWLKGEKSLAEAQAHEGLACKHALDDRNGLTILLETLASMAADRGAHHRAASLLGSAERVRDTALTLIELFRSQHDHTVALAVAGIGKGAFDAAFERGRSMTIDESVDFALNEKSIPIPMIQAKRPHRPPLTRRQLEIARLIADEKSNREIAAKLFLSERTVETHITNILNKVGLNSRTQLARWLTEFAQPDPIGAGADR